MSAETPAHRSWRTLEHKAPARRSSSLHGLHGRRRLIALAKVFTSFFRFMAFMGAAAFIALAKVFTSFFRFMAFIGAAAFIAFAKVFTSFFRRMAFMGAAAFIAFAMTRGGGDQKAEDGTQG